MVKQKQQVPGISEESHSKDASRQKCLVKLGGLKIHMATGTMINKTSRKQCWIIQSELSYQSDKTTFYRIEIQHEGTPALLTVESWSSQNMTKNFIYHLLWLLFLMFSRHNRAMPVPLPLLETLLFIQK